MKSVIYIEQKEEQEENPVEFTHVYNDLSGWLPTELTPSQYNNPNEKIVYLGKCIHDGDMFAAYSNSNIQIFKGHLNSGKY